MPPKHKSRSSVMVLQHAAMLLLLLLKDSCEGQSELVGASKPVVALLGGQALLPCSLEPPQSAADKDLEWSRSGMEPGFVHVRNPKGDFLENQNELFKGRTSMSPEKLERGDLSLTLSNLTIDDNGNYRCYLPEMGQGVGLQLLVGAASSPLITDFEISRGQVVLGCQAKGWYPAPELSWLDGQGRLLPAGPTETLRGPDLLFTVSSRLTAQEVQGETFTCRVQQENTMQSRETLIQMSAWCPWQVPSVVRVLLVLAVCLMCALAIALLVWQLRKASATDACLKKETVQVLKESTQSLKKMLSDIKDQMEATEKHINGVKEKVERCEGDYLEAKLIINSDKNMLTLRKQEDEGSITEIIILLTAIDDVLKKRRGARSRKAGGSLL